MKIKTISILLGTAITLTACGGGGSSTQPTAVVPPSPPVGQADKPTKAVGPISGFGSVIVNGVRYDTDNATFTINGVSGSQDDLDVGKVVVVKAEVASNGNATASEVSYDNNVKGPISSIDTVNSRMVVLGQTIIIDGNTSFDNQIIPSSLDGLIVGDNVEVSGTANANGDIVASRIELENANSDYDVHGTVSAFDSTAQTFQINQLIVDFSQATLEGFDANGLANGLYVEAEGTSLNNAGALIATKVKFEGSDGRDDDHVGDNDDDGELEGLVTEFTSSGNFKVANVSVITNASTTYKRGSAADIALNVRLEVEGTYNANGVLVADEVEFKNGNNDDDDDSNDDNGVDIKVESTLDAIDSANNKITVFGTEFEVDMSTRYEDDSSANVRNFNFSSLAVGDYLEVKGYDRGGNTLYASKIERDDAKNKSELEAFVESVGTDSLVMLGVTVSTNANTRYQDANENNISQSVFFSQLIVGDLVEAEGSKTGSTSLDAIELSIERPDNDD